MTGGFLACRCVLKKHSREGQSQPGGNYTDQDAAQHIGNCTGDLSLLKQTDGIHGKGRKGSESAQETNRDQATPFRPDLRSFGNQYKGDAD